MIIEGFYNLNDCIPCYESRICLLRSKIMHTTGAVCCEYTALILWYNGATFRKAGTLASEFRCLT